MNVFPGVSVYVLKNDLTVIMKEKLVSGNILITENENSMCIEIRTGFRAG